jgi:hypothetical protein
MPDVSENGDIVFTSIDEWGRRRLDSLLEDGTKVIVTAVVTAITVTDSVGLSDVVLCNKTFIISDSVGLADKPFKGWTPTVTDAVSLFETVLLNKAFSILDSVGLADVIYLGKQLTLTDQIALVEVVYAAPVRKTKLFLVIGNLAIQLTGG